MPLELWIHGPGYGESIVLAWDELRIGRNVRCAAVIDACWVEDDLDPFVCRMLDSPEVSAEKIPFVACTHPHDDHISGMSELISSVGSRGTPRLFYKKVERVLWWGGHHRSVMMSYLSALLHQAKDDETRKKAIIAHFEFVHGMCVMAGDYSAGVQPMANEASFVGVRLVYEAKLPGSEGQMRVWSISPHLGPQKKFREELEDRISNKGSVTGGSLKHANHTSLGFLIEYGEAQIILGGDVTSPNWRKFYDEWKEFEGKPLPDEGGPPLPKLHPQVVKVAHHGSNTGDVTQKVKRSVDGVSEVVSSMWQEDKGFFGQMQIDANAKPLAIVTPWKKGSGSLPPDEVLDRIYHSGFRPFVTGKKPHEQLLKGQTGQETVWDAVHACLCIHADKTIEEDLELCWEHKPKNERVQAEVIPVSVRERAED